MAIERSFAARVGTTRQFRYEPSSRWLALLVCGSAFAVACGDDSVVTGQGNDASARDGSDATSSGSSGGSSSSGSSSGGSSGNSSSGGDSGARDATVNDAADSSTLDSAATDSADADAAAVSTCTGDASAAVDCATHHCVSDPLKTQPGACGCGVSDVDTDHDGTPDCVDGCFKDPTRTTPGPCGCGFGLSVDGGLLGEGGLSGDGGSSADGGAGLCLAHRYPFNDTGTTVTDVIGGANGTAVNVTQPGTGSIVLLGGTSDQYVSLPAGMVSALGNSATFETWVTWTGGGAWQRIFDFGSSDQPAGTQGTGQTYIFVTPINSTSLALRAAFTVTGLAGEQTVDFTAPLNANTMVHLAVVLDGAASTMSLYQNGMYLGQKVLAATALANLDDVDNWLGRSQFSADPAFQGTVYEFRIYSAARTAAQVLGSFTAGPDTLPAR